MGIRLSKSQFKRLQVQSPGKYGKYGNIETFNHHAGRSFASKLEGDLYDFLALRVMEGELTELTCQPCVYLTAARIQMFPDFSAVHKEWGLMYFEAKGFQTDIWRIKKKLWKVYGPGRLEVWVRKGKGLDLMEEIVPKGYTE